MSIRTRSATPLSRITIEPTPGGHVSHVWLRRDIIEVPDPDGGSAWEADEVHLTVPGVPTLDELEASFTDLWLAHEEESLTDREYTRARVDELEYAIVELADLLAGGE